jgi:hypothetical protein
LGCGQMATSLPPANLSLVFLLCMHVEERELALSSSSKVISPTGFRPYPYSLIEL